MMLLNLLVGLEERGTKANHDLRLTAFGASDLAYLGCERCGLDVTVMVVNSFGGWRIEPRIVSLDQPCVP